jgi:preprotein translocase subunit SecD
MPRWCTAAAVLVIAAVPGYAGAEQPVRIGEARHLLYGVEGGPQSSDGIAILQQSAEIIARRLSLLNISDTTVEITPAGLLVTAPATTALARLRAVAESPGFLDIHLVRRILDAAPLPGEALAFPAAGGGGWIYEVDPVAWLRREHVAGASVGIDRFALEPTVTLTFGEAGAAILAEATAANIGMTVAIVLDGRVVSAPVVREAIRSGQATIAGGFTLESASLTAALLGADALPARLVLVKEWTAGSPRCGQGRSPVRTGC